MVPAIADYEVRRELERAGRRQGLAQLDAFNAARADRYLALSDMALRLAARLILDSRVLYLLYVSASLPWRQTLAGAMVVESGQLIAHSLTLHAATDGGHTKRQERLEQQYAQPVAYLWEGQGRRPLLPPVGVADQEPDRDQGQRHVMMPALPGPHLVRVHGPAGACPHWSIKCFAFVQMYDEKPIRRLFELL